MSSDVIIYGVLTPVALTAAIAGGTMISLFAEHLAKKRRKGKTIDICFDKNQIVKAVKTWS